MRKKKHLGFLFLGFYIKKRMLLALLLSMKIGAKKQFLTLPHVFRNRRFLATPPPDLLPLFEEVLFLREESFIRLEGLILSEAEKLRNRSISQEEFFQEARLVALTVIDSLKFPKIELIVRTLKLRLSCKQNNEKAKDEACIDLSKISKDEEPFSDDELMSAFLYRNSLLPQGAQSNTEEPSLLKIARETGLHEIEEFLTGKKKQLASFVVGSTRFLLQFFGLGYG